MRQARRQLGARAMETPRLVEELARQSRSQLGAIVEADSRDLGRFQAARARDAGHEAIDERRMGKALAVCIHPIAGWHRNDAVERLDQLEFAQPARLDDRQIGRAHVELQSLMRISYAVFCLKKKNKTVYH